MPAIGGAPQSCIDARRCGSAFAFSFAERPARYRGVDGDSGSSRRIEHVRRFDTEGTRRPWRTRSFAPNPVPSADQTCSGRRTRGRPTQRRKRPTAVRMGMSSTRQPRGSVLGAACTTPRKSDPRTDGSSSCAGAATRPSSTHDECLGHCRVEGWPSYMKPLRTDTFALMASFSGSSSANMARSSGDRQACTSGRSSCF